MTAPPTARPAAARPAGAHRALLGGERGLDVGVRLRGAGSALGLGGDWYLAAVLPRGDVVLAVGDVMGRGSGGRPGPSSGG
ncbi:hypothetical protein [Actinomadura parmotrematis]|uniref:hypothetical protein n=1 Tax=Actinomadura parmotrematis TaxID=2864039 RepID=UPI00215D6488|nr:hypothetical protein [Actinomadura parmotrematis]